MTDDKKQFYASLLRVKQASKVSGKNPFASNEI